MTPAKRVLVLSWDGGGCVPPAINLAARLARRGHAVRLLGWPSMADRVRAAGVDFAAYPSFTPWLEDAPAEETWDERMVPFLHGAATRQDIVAEARRFAADRLVVDCLMGAGFDAASRLGLPTAVLVHVLYAPFARDWGSAVLQRPIAPLLTGAEAVLAVSPPGLDEPTELPANTAYVGPITHPNPPRWPSIAGATELRDALGQPGDPWVLLSLSTTLQHQERSLPGLLAALGAAPVRVLLTLGGAASVDGPTVPPNVVVHDQLAHDLVLPSMSAVVCHAGLGTVNAALSHGVPLLCIPQGREQPDNAARVVAAGAGRSLPADAPPEAITAELVALLADRSARTAAGRFADAVRSVGHGELAADMVEDISLLAAVRPSG